MDAHALCTSDYVALAVDQIIFLQFNDVPLTLIN